MNINVTYDSSVTSQSNAAQIEGAIQAAVRFYEAEFTTSNITINIDFKYAPLGAGAAAENSFSYETFTYAQVVAALKAHDTSAVDQAASPRSQLRVVRDVLACHNQRLGKG